MVIVIVAILSAVMVPVYQDRQLEAEANSMAYTVRTVRTWVKSHRAEHGSWPHTIDPAWFDRPVANLWGTDANAERIWNSTLPDNVYPSDKTVHVGSANSMWYNRVNGSFCAKVRARGTNAESLALFNRVNEAAASSMSETKKLAAAVPTD